MQRKRDFIAEERIGVREIFDMEPHRPVCRQHGQRDVVNVAGNSTPRHFCKDGVSLLRRNPRHPADVQMPRGLMVRSIVRQAGDAQRGKGRVIAANDFFAARQHFRIPVKLREPDRGCQIGQVVLISRMHDVIRPDPGSVFVKRVYGLAVEAE